MFKIQKKIDFHSEIEDLRHKIRKTSFRLTYKFRGALTSQTGDNLSPFKTHDFRLSFRGGLIQKGGKLSITHTKS